jgi:hypothetical protein
MTTRKFILLDQDRRKRAADHILNHAPGGYEVVVREEKKRRAQEERYHAMIHDIQRSGCFRFLDRADWSAEDIKRLLVEAFAQEMQDCGTPLRQSGQVVPSLDYRRTVQLGIQTRDFSVKEASAFIEYLYAWGAAQGMRFKSE